MKLLDSRRLTGINVVWEHPGAVVDVELAPGDNADLLIARWCAHADAMLDAVGWSKELSTAYRYIGGVGFAISAPVDSLYAAVDVAQWAYDALVDELNGHKVSDFSQQAQRLRRVIRAERNVALTALADAAAAHNVAFLSDDDDVSIGLGRGCKVWPVNSIPAQIDWPVVSDIPVALVTGVNGKTTTVRIASHILQAAGFSVGMSSTDWVGVDDQIIDRGDYSGPGGARTALRQSSASTAVLETARGGLLRRGLGVQRADAALITNIAEDHLGDFGSRNLTELLNLKWIVMRALDQHSTAILNADDPLLVSKSSELTEPELIWFCFDAQNHIAREHIQQKGKVVAVINESIARFDGTMWHALCPVVDIAVTLNGLARHNVANALAAVALCHALGVDDKSIVKGLTSMTLADNPGRCNLFHIDERKVILDFAHNPKAMEGIFDVARNHPAKRRVLCFGQAGDRTDELIRDLARSAWAIGLDRVIISELAEHSRGRAEGEVFQLLRDELISAGAKDAQISHQEHEFDALNEALEWAEAGDLVIMIGLAESPKLLAHLKALESGCT